MQNTISQTETTSTPEDLVRGWSQRLKRVTSLRTLELHQKRLNYLAQNFDPFAGEMDNECRQIVDLYQLVSVTSDPFRFTNVVLQLLDTLDERKKLLFPQS